MSTNKFLVINSLICFILSATCLQVSAAKNSDKPNVIIICANDLGKGMLSVYGQKHLSTPNIDQLFKDGVSFSNAYGGAATAYARAALFTGYFDCRKNYWRITRGGSYSRADTAIVSQSEQFIDGANVLLPENDPYLPQVFSSKGYVTGEIGMLEWGYTTTRQQMQQHGWDYYYGYLDLIRSRGMYPPFIFENGQIALIEGNTRADCGVNIEPETDQTFALRHNMDGKAVYAPELFINKAIEFIREFKSRPFFLMYNPNLPGTVSIPNVYPEIVNNELLSPLEKEYASMVKLLDDQVGRIISEIQSLNLEDNTLIIFTSHNGHEIYYQQENRIYKPYSDRLTGEKFDNSYFKFYSDKAGDVFNGNAGLAGVKGSSLEGGLTVPLTFYWKRKLKNNISDQFVASCDLLPTLADLIGTNLTKEKDGLSYLKTLTKGAKLSKNKYVVFTTDEGPALIVNDGWKLRFLRGKQKYELYNIRKDPLEKYDVILKNPEKASELTNKLLKELNGNIENGFTN